MKTGLGKALLVALVLTATLSSAAVGAASPDRELLRSLQLTDDQVIRLDGLLQQYHEKQSQALAQIAAKTAELEREFLRPGRLADEKQAAASAKRANTLIRDFTKLYAQAFKTRVEYMLKAKDVLTMEQKVRLIASLDFDLGTIDDLERYEELDWLNSGLDLTYDQARRILRYRTDRKVAELQLNLKIDLRVLDLEEMILAGQYNPKKANKIVLDITDLATQQLDNLVEHFLKTKDVLTIAQKRQVMHMLMMR